MHISALSNKFVRDPREVVKTGDVVKVKVLEVDVKRRRIALTMRLDEAAPRVQGRPAAEGRDKAGGVRPGQGGPRGQGHPREAGRQAAKESAAAADGAMAEALRRALQTR